MPFLRDYVCNDGHRTEHFHAGSSATAPTSIACGTCHAPAAPRIEAKLPKPGPLGAVAEEYRRRGIWPAGI